LTAIAGKFVIVKKTIHIDDGLVRAARAACGAGTDAETIRLGLESLVRHAPYRRLRSLQGSEPDARDVPRRRERPPAQRRGESGGPARG
jgi:hypothetical protein